MTDKYDVLPYLNFDGDTVTVYVESWWDDEYIQLVAMTLAYAERMIGRTLEYVYTQDPPPPHLKRADEMFKDRLKSVPNTLKN